MVIKSPVYLPLKLFQMKKTYLAIAATAVVALGLISCVAEEKTYTLDASKTTLQWEGTFVGDGHSHKGMIAVTNGTVTYKGEEFQSGNFVIDMNSISTSDLSGGKKQSLDNHLKNTGKPGEEADFFDAIKFPDTKVTVKEVSDKEMKLVINVMGNDVNAIVPAKVVKMENQLIATAKFSVDFTSAGIKAFKEDPKQPKMYISPELKFDLQLVMNAEK